MSSLARRIAQGKLSINCKSGKKYDTRRPAAGGWPKPINSIAVANRHTGKSHKHAREIARRLRQSR